VPVRREGAPLTVRVHVADHDVSHRPTSNR
jgi:hypothetical protein